MALTIYGSARSRTMRVLWAAEELGLAYQHAPYEWDDPALKSPEFLAISPAGQIPAIVDDGFALSESLAILLYLTKKHGRGGLYPEDLAAEAEVWRWALWAQGSLEAWVLQDARLAEMRAVTAPAAAAEVRAALQTLERRLGQAPWLAADRFTVADMCVAAVLSPSRAKALDLSPYPAVRAWLARCYGRPACLAVRERFAP
jgi:glutathione S-transferase